MAELSDVAEWIQETAVGGGGVMEFFDDSAPDVRAALDLAWWELQERGWGEDAATSSPR